MAQLAEDIAAAQVSSTRRRSRRSPRCSCAIQIPQADPPPVACAAVRVHARRRRCRLRHGHSIVPPTARRPACAMSRRRDERAAPSRRTARGIQRLVHETLHEEGRRRGAEREPHHAAARCGRRRRRRDADRVLERSDSPFGMALVGNDALRREHRRAGALSLSRRATRRSPRAGSKVATLPGPADQPSLDEEPHRERRTARSSTSTVGSNSNAARERHRRGEGARGDLGDRSARPGSIASSPPACAIPSASRGSRDAARCGCRSTSATSSEAISCPTT